MSSISLPRYISTFFTPSLERFTLERTITLSFLPLLFALPVGRYVGVDSPIFCGLMILHFLGYLVGLIGAANILIRLLPVSKGLRLSIGGLVAGLAIYLVCLGTCPPTARDALTHHLAIPRLWIEQGYIKSTPWHGWSSYPMLVQIAFTFLLQHFPDSSCATYHGCYLLILAACTAHLGERLADGVGGLAALLIFLNPNLCRLATIPLVEIPLCIFAVITLTYAVWFITNTPDHSRNASFFRSHVLFFGLAIGFLASCKPNGGIFGGIVWAVVVMLISFRNTGACRLHSLRLMIAAGVIGLLVYAPWAVKAHLEQGSFFYPFAKGFDPYPTRAGALSTTPLIRRTLLYDETFLDVATVPIRMFLTGEDDNPSHFDGVLAPILLLGLCPLATSIRTKKTSLTQIAIVLFLGASLVGEVARVRYLAPLFGPLAAITACHLRRSPPQLRRMVFGLSLTFSGLYLTGYQVGRGQYDYLVGTLSRDQYLIRNVPEYRMIQFLNSSLPKSGKAYLILTSNPFYYCPENVFSPGHYSDKALVSWLQNSHSDREFEQAVTNAGITHFAGSYRRTPESLKAQLTADEFSTWDRYASNHLISQYQDEQFGVWEVAAYARRNAD